ncbi:MAG: HAD family phosphatase [Candidatus Actinomarinales bacterium]|nr:MAG: HAD family phosphatase [Candidatus Actinomarinales bacterium]
MDKVTTVVWDLDGTLLDTEALFAKAWQLVMKDYDLEIPDKTIKNFAGMDDRIVHAELSKKVNLPDFQTTMNMLHNAIRGKLSDKDLVFNDVVPCLEFLLKKNITQGCASASPEEMVLEKLTKSNLVGYFESIYGGDMVENNKPSPDIYLSTFKQLDVKPENVLIVEDSPYGIEAGIRSGARVLAIDRGMFTLDQLSQADYNLENLDLNFFESII